jgi:hypothetical protein
VDADPVRIVTAGVERQAGEPQARFLLLSLSLPER